MSARVRPFLMFQGVQAEAAMNFYLSLFDDAEILEWLFTPHDELGEAPFDTLLSGHKARVRRVAQSEL